jgi:capsular polysaccharide biosynthesis protein
MNLENLKCIQPGKLDPKWAVISGYSMMSPLTETVLNKAHLDFGYLISSQPRLESPSFLAYNSAYGNHYHIVMEWLPSFLEFIELADSAALLLLPESQRHNEVIVAALDLLGLWPRVRFLNDQISTPIGFSTLYYSSYLHGLHNYQPSSTVMDFFKALGNSVAPSKFPAPERLYLSRADSKNRIVENESQLMAELCMDYGFTAVTLGNMPFALQVHLLKNAKVIISPHGAGLVNLVFKGDHERVIYELQPASYKNSCFEVIAVNLGDCYKAISMHDVASGGHQHQIRSRIDEQGLNELRLLISALPK